MESDVRYYHRRAIEEEQRAARAITPEARQRHRELAALFAQRAAGPVAEEARLVRG